MTDDNDTRPPQDADTTYQAELTRVTLIVAAWLANLIDPDQVVELRALRVADGTRGGSTWAGMFRGDELHELARQALELSGLCQGVYYTLNPLKPESFVKQAPRVQRAHGGSLAHDQDVIQRRWLIVDIDPVKPSKQQDDSATEHEKAKTLEVAKAVRRYLASEGWPAPILCDSGNGHHLLYRLAEPMPVTLPVKDDDALRRVLMHLADKFSGPDGMIDDVVFNPGRIVKFPGTRACKGEATAERPHRRARVLEVPEQ